MPVSTSYIKKNAQAYDKIFCMMSKKYGLKKLLLKALAIRESALDPKAYRHEPGFWNRYLKNNSKWKDKDPALVSSSWGLCQLMYVVAVELGFPMGMTGEELCDPVTNIELAAKHLRRSLDLIHKKNVCVEHIGLNPLVVAIARYNGGAGGNPDNDGRLRTQAYADKVIKTWSELILEESECDES